MTELSRNIWALGFVSLLMDVSSEMVHGLMPVFLVTVLAAYAADSVPSAYRATAFGAFHLISGVIFLAASVLAGALWQVLGPTATFRAGAGIPVVGLAALVTLRRPAPPAV